MKKGEMESLALKTPETASDCFLRERYLAWDKELVAHREVNLQTYLKESCQIEFLICLDGRLLFFLMPWHFLL